ncbi:hypothetical protein [Nocardioides daphniae]|uniref:DUF2269 family protein n=1 Tax=Nocardioides daphniae TaxID=402297 RepID=A0A4P7U9E6_9ACTN|nr:hypothetical protein [Nocardioides daphniae]QCC76680.1 hypothetical protein E2C04_04630 [Nocardioides daphniae]
MSPEIIVWVLSFLGAVVVVLTRVRLGKELDDGTKPVSRTILTVHTSVGLVAVVVWTLFLVFPPSSTLGGDLVGVAGLGLWWVTVFAGLGLLLRWLPSRGRHTSSLSEDEWAEGPGLSLLAHAGLLLGVLVFTWAFATGTV